MQQQVVLGGHSWVASHSTGSGVGDGGEGLGGLGPGGVGPGGGAGGLGPFLRGYDGCMAIPHIPALPRPIRSLM